MAADVLRRFDLTDRVVVVTGGTRGLGLAMARGFGAVGAKVVVASRKTDACAAAQRRLEDDGTEALGVPTHLGELTDLEALVAATVERFGAVDIVVNNAANALAQPMGGYTRAAWDKAHHVNLQGPVFLTQYALEHLAASRHGGVVLNVVTAGAFRGAAGLAIYTAAKAALLNWTRSMAQELGPRGIRVNALAPGPFDTDMVRANDEAVQAGMRDATILGRIASPDEIVGPALFLVSDASSYVTGTALVVDGGLLA